MAILTLPSGCYNVLTLPPQVTDLVVTTAPATINVQFTPPPAEYSEGVEYWVVYKEGGIPQHPYDGNFQKLDGGGGQVYFDCVLTSGVENDVEYGVRIFVRSRYGYQTALLGATALVTPRAGQPVTNLADGVNPATLRIGEGNSGVNFLLLKHNYEGSGGSLLLRKDIYDRRAFNASNINTYAASDIDVFANGDYFSLLEDSTRMQVITVEIPYTIGGGNSTMGKLPRKVFILSAGEMGVKPLNTNEEGSALPYFNSNERRVAYFNDVATIQWTRTPDNKYPSDAARIWQEGFTSCGYVTEKDGFRPAIVVPSDFMLKLTPNADGTYSPISSVFADNVA